MMKKSLSSIDADFGITKLMEKEQLRKEIFERLIAQDPEERRKKSQLIKEKLFTEEQFKSAHYIMFYVSKKEEVDTSLMIEEALEIGKKVVVPITLVKEKKLVCSLVENPKEDLSPGPYGIKQPRQGKIRPVPIEKIDLVVVPGIVFDEENNRLGRGEGYYDRFLRTIPTHIPKIGLAFSVQVLKRLPVLSHDVAVSKLLSA